MRRDSRLLFVVSSLSASLLALGCGDSDKKPSAEAGGEPIAPGASASVVDAGKPAAPDQLAGGWFRLDDPADARVDDGDVIGIEFAADGKLALIGRPVGRQAPVERTVQYAKLDNGRVRLSTDASAVVSAVIQCKLNGDTLTIVPETSTAALGFNGGQFQRLPPGKTIAARYGERIKERQAEAAALGAKLAELLKQPNLAIVPADGGGPGSLRVALNVKENGSMLAGTGQMTVANATVERQVQVVPVANTTPPTVTVTLGPVTGPAGAKPMQQETFVFAATSKDGTLTLKDNRAHALKADADATKQLADAYAAAVKKQRDLLDTFHAKLGALILAEGEPRPNQPTPRAALMRVPDKDQYLLAAYAGSESSLLPTSFTIPHVVMLQDDEPLLVNPQTRQILAITGTGDARAFEGAINGTPSRMKITRTMSIDDVKAKQAEIKAFLDGMKATPLALVGQFYESYPYEMGKVTPSRIELSSADGKTLAGTYHAEASGTDIAVAGEATPTLLGIAVKYAATGTVTRPDGRFVEGYPCTATIELVDGKPALTGRFQNGDGACRLVLAPVADAARTAALRKQLDAELAKGGAFKWARTGNTGTGTDVMTLALKPGDSASTIAGTVGFRRGTAPVAGTIAEDRGQLVIDLTVAETPPKSVAAGTMRLWVLPYGDTFYLSGSRTWKAEPTKSFICYGPATP